ncbi:hypothetical protein ACWD4G_05515 [Streptomyces sp. NPDC002643]
MGGYGFFQLDGKTVAGALRNPPEQGPPSWNVYFRTPDADATAKAAEHAHGSVLPQPMDVAEEGRMAILADSKGVPFRLWQPHRMDSGSYTCVNPARTEEQDMSTGLVPLDEDPAEAGSGRTGGRFAKLTDPYGTRFAVIKSVPPQG